MHRKQRFENGYELDTDPGRLDVPRVIKWLLEEAYWTQGRDAKILTAAFENSLCFGMYAPAGEQVAFARAVTDYATFAWLCDVFVHPEHRGIGLGKQLIAGVVEDPRLAFGRFLLATRDAHGLYERHGFIPLRDATNWMERLRRR
jgi:GNAT superfamily N-acetyltransferase